MRQVLLELLLMCIPPDNWSLAHRMQLTLHTTRRKHKHPTALCAWCTRKTSVWSVKNPTCSVPALQGCEGLWAYFVRLRVRHDNAYTPLPSPGVFLLPGILDDWGFALARGVFSRDLYSVIRPRPRRDKASHLQRNQPEPTHLENNVELRVQVRLETFPLQDGLELVQKLERVLDGSDVLEALVDKRLPVLVSETSQGRVRPILVWCCSPSLVTTV